jgi:hypothetical protein
LRSRLGAPARRDQPSIAKDRDLVGDLEDFLHSVAHKENRDALPFQILHELEELLNFVRGERGRRLVHDQDADIHRDGFGDLDRLLRGEGEAAGGASDVERHAEFR